MNKPLDQLMQKQMTRKEFIGTLALGLGSILGFSTIIHLLSGKQLTHSGISHSYGYGSSTYGGHTVANSHNSSISSPRQDNLLKLA